MSDPEPWAVGVLGPADDTTTADIVGDLPVDLHLPASRDVEAARGLLDGVDMLVADWTGELKVDTRDLVAARHLAFIQKPGSGIEEYDLDLLDEAKIPLANTAGTTAMSMAEWCVGAAIALTRRIVDADRWVRSGEWPQLKLAERGGRELASMRVGVVGYGPIGALACERFAAMGCEVAFWSRRERSLEETGGIPWVSLDQLIAASELIVVAIALTPETRHLFSGPRIEVMPEGSFIVNVARGAVIDEEALVDNLVTGHLAGAALDVFESEPLPESSPLRDIDRVILSPHSSGNTPESRTRLFAAVRENLARAVEGTPVHWVVNHVSPTIVRRR